MGKFLEKYNLPKLSEVAESLNRPITADKIKASNQKTPAHQSLGPESFTGEFYKIFQKSQLQSFKDFPPQKNPRRGETLTFFL